MFSPGRAPYNFSFLWAVNNARYTAGTTGLALFPTHGFPAARRLFSLTRRMVYIHPRLAFTRFHLFIRRRKLRCARCCSGAPASFSSLLFPRHQLLFLRFFIFLSPKRETWLRLFSPDPVFYASGLVRSDPTEKCWLPQRLSCGEQSARGHVLPLHLRRNKNNSALFAQERAV